MATVWIRTVAHPVSRKKRNQPCLEINSIRCRLWVICQNLTGMRKLDMDHVRR